MPLHKCGSIAFALVWMWVFYLPANHTAIDKRCLMCVCMSVRGPLYSWTSLIIRLSILYRFVERYLFSLCHNFAWVHIPQHHGDNNKWDTAVKYNLSLEVSANLHTQDAMRCLPLCVVRCADAFVLIRIIGYRFLRLHSTVDRLSVPCIPISNSNGPSFKGMRLSATFPHSPK